MLLFRWRGEAGGGGGGGSIDGIGDWRFMGKDDTRMDDCIWNLEGFRGSWDRPRGLCV